MFCAIFYLEGLEGAYVSHLIVTNYNCLWWGYLMVFIDFLTGGRGALNILAIWVCPAGKGMVFKPFSLG